VAQDRGEHQVALILFSQAQKQGYVEYALYYQRGRSLTALGQMDAAWHSYTAALNLAQQSQDMAAEQHIRTARVEASMALKKYDEAIHEFKTLLQHNPSDSRFAQGLGMALLGRKAPQAAIQMFEQLIRDPQAAKAPAHYGRALALAELGLKTAALQDIDRALELEPGNSQYARARAAIATTVSH